MKQLPKASPANNFHYNKKLRDRARELRNHSTKTEIYLWNDVLKNGKLRGCQFLRQRPVLHFIADFMCTEMMLIIEVDGISHESEDAIQYDMRRTKLLEEIGFTVLRFSDWEVLFRIADVVIMLREWILDWERRNGILRADLEE